MVKFSDDSPEYRVVIRFLDALLHTVTSDSNTLVGSKQLRSSEAQDSSQRRKSKGLKAFKNVASAFHADSSGVLSA
jgi:hypothetical protein